MSGVDDIHSSRKNHKAPYTPHHPVPTIHKYREEKHDREEKYGTSEGNAGSDDGGKRSRIGEAYTTLRYGKEANNPDESTQPYMSQNKNIPHEEELADDHAGRLEKENKEKENGENGDSETAEDTTQGVSFDQNPKKARKEMKKHKPDGTEREVTDPVTHLPIKVHDFTDKELKGTPENGPSAGSEPRSATGSAGRDKSDEQLKEEEKETQEGYDGMARLFPPPDFQVTRDEITKIYRRSMTIGLAIVSGSLTLIVAFFQLTRFTTGWSRTLFTTLEVLASVAVSVAIIVGMRTYTENRINGAWDSEVWHAEREQGKKWAKSQTAESAQWLNSLLASIWPLINPDLFTAIGDTLEVNDSFNMGAWRLTKTGCHASIATKDGSHGFC